MKEIVVGIYKMFIEPIVGLWLVLSLMMAIGCYSAAALIMFLRWIGVNI